MKKIDLFVIKSFAGPFLGSFFIATLFFVLQLFWVLIGELAGKGLDLTDILKFTMYVSMLSVANAFPISILVGSIMTFGHLSETSEITSMRATGLSFSRIALPIGFLSILLVLVAFCFQNYVMPKANLKLTSLRYNIISSKPAFSLGEGTFYDEIDGFVILVDKKEADNKHVEDVIIYQEANQMEDHLMVSKKGLLTQGDEQSESSLRFILQDGSFYQTESDNTNQKNKSQFIRFDFNTYIKDFPLWQFSSQSSDSLFMNSATTQNLSDLQVRLSKSTDLHNTSYEQLVEYYKQDFPIAKYLFNDTLKVDSTKKIKMLSKSSPVYKLYQKRLSDSKNDESTSIGFYGWMSRVDYLIKQLEESEKQKRSSVVEISKKFIMSVICFIFFLVGVPLGNMIKKGGVGLPLLLAVIIFTVFLFSSIFGNKISKAIMGPDPYITPWWGSIVLFVIGIVLFLRLLGLRFTRK